MSAEHDRIVCKASSRRRLDARCATRAPSLAVRRTLGDGTSTAAIVRIPRRTAAGPCDPGRPPCIRALPALACAFSTFMAERSSRSRHLDQAPVIPQPHKSQLPEVRQRRLSMPASDNPQQCWSNGPGRSLIAKTSLCLQKRAARAGAALAPPSISPVTARCLIEVIACMRLVLDGKASIGLRSLFKDLKN